MPTTYELVVTPTEDLWHIQIPELDGATQAESIHEIEAMGIDYISIITGEPAETVQVTTRFLRRWQQPETD